MRKRRRNMGWPHAKWKGTLHHSLSSVSPFAPRKDVLSRSERRQTVVPRTEAPTPLIPQEQPASELAMWTSDEAVVASPQPGTPRAGPISGDPSSGRNGRCAECHLRPIRTLTAPSSLLRRTDRFFFSRDRRPGPNWHFYHAREYHRKSNSRTPCGASARRTLQLGSVRPAELATQPLCPGRDTRS